MGYECNFPGCRACATRYETMPVLPYVDRSDFAEVAVVRVFCANHFGHDECLGHVASEADPKVCGRCGIHIDDLRPD